MSDHAHPELGVVCGLVQRFRRVCAENVTDAEQALDWFTDASLAAAITTFCHWGTESPTFRKTDRATDGASEREHSNRGPRAHGLRLRLR
jgi:hypothetical protein